MILKWLSYPRSVLASLFLIVFTVVYSFYVVPKQLLFPNVGYATSVTRFWSRVVLLIFNVSVRTQGLENLKSGQNGIMLFNHISLFDIPVMFTSIDKHLRFGAKAELFRIPFFGQAIRALGILPIYRADRDRVMELYRQSMERVRGGETMVLAPEGTRQDGIQLGPFKAGPFVFAIEGQFPILPVVMFGNHFVQSKDSLLPQWGRWHTEVVLKVLPSITTESLTLSDRPNLQERTRRLMAEAYGELVKRS